MIKTTIEEGFRIVLPENIRGRLHVGDEVVVERDSSGRIVIATGGSDLDLEYPVPAVESALGRQLREIRQRIVSSGTPLLDWESLDQEIADRRGEN